MTPANLDALNDKLNDKLIMSAIIADVWDAFPDGEADWIRMMDARRMLAATDGDDILARTKLKRAVLWRHSTLEPWLAMEPPRPYEVRVVAMGIDSRPMLYGCAIHQMKGEIVPQEYACAVDNALDELPPLTYVDLVIDAHGFDIFMNLDLTPWITIAQSLDSYFAERVNSIFVIDMPTVAQILWLTVRPLLPPKTRDKVHFLSSSMPEEMLCLYEYCVDEDMIKMLKELLSMNREATQTLEDRLSSHKFTNDFLEEQKMKSQRRSQEVPSRETSRRELK